MPERLSTFILAQRTSGVLPMGGKKVTRQSGVTRVRTQCNVTDQNGRMLECQSVRNGCPVGRCFSPRARESDGCFARPMHVSDTHQGSQSSVPRLRPRAGHDGVSRRTLRCGHHGNGDGRSWRHRFSLRARGGCARCALRVTVPSRALGASSGVLLFRLQVTW